MRWLLVLAIGLILSTPAFAEDLPKEDFMRRYLAFVDQATAISRIVQMYDALGPAAKATARTQLKSDLEAAANALLAARETEFIAPIEEIITDVNDTTLP